MRIPFRALHAALEGAGYLGDLRVEGRFLWALLFSVILSVPAAGQVVSTVELRTEGEIGRLRPLESVVVQLRGYGTIQGEDDKETRVRVRIDNTDFRIVEENGGWLSKPFRYQGEEKEKVYEPESTSLVDRIVGRARDDFLRLDSVLYTAPKKPGTYTIEAVTGNFTDRLSIRVDSGAPPLRLSETRTFRAEPRSTDPYLRLAQRYAPFIAQATWFDPKADYLARFDFDGDWKGDNNWDSTPTGSSQAYVYYAAIESETHWFLIYSFFHPRDYSDKCVAGSCHENDSEGLILTVLKDGTDFGRIQVLETLAHDNIYSYRHDKRIKKGIHGFDGSVVFTEDDRPAVFVESGGHGVYSVGDSRSKYSLSGDEFSPGTGVTYVFQGRAERPAHPDDRRVGYELLPIYEHWWRKAHPGTQASLESFAEYFDYQPYGGRPDVVFSEISGAFLGNRYGSNKAKPFWGWHDRKTSKKKVVATGQWGLDPAYAISRNLKFPKPYSLSYVYNPYLAVGRDTPSRRRKVGPDSPGPRQTVGIPPREGIRRAGWFEARSTSLSSGNRRTGQFDLRVEVDEGAEFWVQENRVLYWVEEGMMPRDWGTDFTQELPGQGTLKVSLKKVVGRGKVTLLESPGDSNGFTAKIQIQDPKTGPSRYHVQLTWSR